MPESCSLVCHYLEFCWVVLKNKISKTKLLYLVGFFFFLLIKIEAVSGKEKSEKSEKSAGTLLESSRAAVIWSCQGCVDGKLCKTDRRNFWPCLTLDNHPSPQPGCRACMATSTSNGIIKNSFQNLLLALQFSYHAHLLPPTLDTRTTISQ